MLDQNSNTKIKFLAEYIKIIIFLLCILTKKNKKVKLKTLGMFKIKKKFNQNQIFGFAQLSDKIINLKSIHGEFAPGSGRTLAACLTHASRTSISF